MQNIAAPPPIHSAAFGTSQLQTPTASPGGTRPLGVVGWNVRYDYKLAVFAELRCDFQSAMKHYEDAYNALMEIIKSEITVKPSSSTPLQSLTNLFPGPNTAGAYYPPYSKRWEEAFQLADHLAAQVLFSFSANP